MKRDNTESYLIYCCNPLESSLSLKHYELIIKDEAVVVCTPGLDTKFLEEKGIKYNLADTENSLEDIINCASESQMEELKLIFLIEDGNEALLDRYLCVLLNDKKIPVKKEKFLDLQKKSSLEDLMNTMSILRGEKGCPWDKKQNHETLKPYLIEEAYEVIDAIDNNSFDDLCEELGDLLLQIIFHTNMAEQKGEFSLDDVLKGLKEKLIRRHPHVFSDTRVANIKQVTKNWNEIKKKEGKQVKNESKILKDSKKLPALLRAEKIQSQAKVVGFDWENEKGAIKKMKEELMEFENAYEDDKKEKIEEELGDLLFSVVNVARFMNVSAELSLVKTINKFYRRFTYIEENITKQDLNISDFELKDLDELWEKAKKSGF